MRRYVIGTVGHVDHGKTALVRALTGVDTDRLPEEKRRGISIELGFARFASRDLDASIIDVPGHHRLVHAMIAGAAGMELVLVVIAADDGVMAQTREHLAIVRALGIEHAVVAITKIDAAADGARAEEEARACVPGAAIVRCSARTGEGMDALRSAIAGALQRLPPEPRGGAPWLAIDRVFALAGAGTVVTGTLACGTIAVNDAVVVSSPDGARRSRVRGLRIHETAIERAFGPTRLAIALADVDRDEIARGDVVADRPIPARTVFDVAIDRDDMPDEIAIHAGSARVPGRVGRIDGSFARIRALEPIVVAPGQRLVLRSASRARDPYVAGARVLDAAPRERGPHRLHLLDALASGDAARALAVAARGAVPRSLAPSAIAERFGIVASEPAVDPEHVERLVEDARRWVAEHARASPLSSGMPVETLRAMLVDRSDAIVADRVLALAKLHVENGVVKVRARDPKAEAAVVAIELALVRAGVHGASEAVLAEMLDRKMLRAVLARLSKEARIVRAGELWFDSRVVDRARLLVRAHFENEPRLTVIRFKALAGLARKQAIALLELFDREGITKRIGDARERA